MIRIGKNGSVALVCIGLTAALFAAAGCQSSQPPPPPGPSGGGAMTAPGGQSAGSGPGGETAGSEGADLAAKSCRCHYGGGRAPDLSHIGSDSSHTAGWIAEYADNPKSKDPSSRMPPLQGKVSSEDLQKIATYLASQK